MKGRLYRKLLKRGTTDRRTTQRMRAEIRRRERHYGRMFIDLGFVAVCGARAFADLGRAMRGL